MPIELTLGQLTSAEKLQLAETLWDDLARNSAEFRSPDWHKEALEECRRKVESGEEQFTDWATPKEEIRRSVT